MPNLNSKFLKFYFANPVRIFQQVKYKYFLRKNPGVPWMAPGAIKFLDAEIKPEHKMFEWGSGGSTAWFANRCKEIVSIENNQGWFQKVQGMFKEQKLSNIDYRFIETDESLDQKEAIRTKALPEYVKVISEFSQESFDIIIIDGSFRHICINHAPTFLKSGGLLVLDNSNWCSFEKWGAPKDWEIVCHDDVGVSCTTIWKKP